MIACRPIITTQFAGASSISLNYTKYHYSGARVAFRSLHAEWNLDVQKFLVWSQISLNSLILVPARLIFHRSLCRSVLAGCLSHSCQTSLTKCTCANFVFSLSPRWFFCLPTISHQVSLHGASDNSPPCCLLVNTPLKSLRLLVEN